MIALLLHMAEKFGFVLGLLTRRRIWTQQHGQTLFWPYEIEKGIIEQTCMVPV